MDSSSQFLHTFFCCHLLLTTPVLRSSFWPSCSNSFRVLSLLTQIRAQQATTLRMRNVLDKLLFFILCGSESTLRGLRGRTKNENNNSSLMDQADHDRFEPINNCLRKCTRDKCENTKIHLHFWPRFIYSPLSFIVFEWFFLFEWRSAACLQSVL